MFSKKKRKNKKQKQGSNGKIRRAKVSRVKKNKIRYTIKKRKKRKKQVGVINWKKFGVIFLMACFLIFVVWVLFFSDVVNIKVVDVVGYNERREEIIQKTEELKKNSFLKKVSLNNLILFPVNKLIGDIKKDNLIVREVVINKVFPDKLIITIKKRQKIFLWKQQYGCKLLGEFGEVLEEINCGKYDEELLTICNNKKEVTGFNCYVFINESDDNIEDESVENIMTAGSKILNELQKTFYFEDKILVIIPSLISNELKIKSERHGEIWFALDKDIDRQLKKFRALLESKIEINELENIQHIDLRLNNKIIYKFKEGFVNEELMNEENEESINEELINEESMNEELINDN